MGIKKHINASGCVNGLIEIPPGNSTERRGSGIFAEMSFSFRERAQSFRHAIRGVILIVRSQHNAWIHLLAAVGVVFLGVCLGLALIEWCALIFAIALVWVAEALNTAIEFLADEISLEKRERIGNAKDAGAAGVLLAAIGSAIIGLLVFVPHFFK